MDLPLVYVNKYTIIVVINSGKGIKSLSMLLIIIGNLLLAENVHMVTRRYQSLTETSNLQGYSYFNGPAVGLNEKPNSRV